MHGEDYGFVQLLAAIIVPYVCNQDTRQRARAGPPRASPQKGYGTIFMVFEHF